MPFEIFSERSLEQRVDYLEPVVRLFKELGLEEKISFFKKEGFDSYEGFLDEHQYIINCLKLIDQWDKISLFFEEKEELLRDLFSLDQFYAPIGGILGYHLEILKALEGKETKVEKSYFPPNSVDLTKLSHKVKEEILIALENLPKMVELYPLGGAADRLHLVDEKTQSPLPAARLPFRGKGLLRVLVEDVEAREYLYFKLFKKQCKTPICLMTSNEKNNHNHVLSILKENHWFYRGKSSFFLFTQPSVPTVDAEGRWCIEKIGTLKKKPGGHGVLWKMLLDKSLFPILKTLGRKKALVRQINNPIAGCDFSLLAFMGHGLKKDLDFGFIGCPPLEGTKEGRNVLVEVCEKKGFRYYLSNIEYCQQSLEKTGEKNFLSNTNLLFCDLNTVEKAVLKEPFPGTLINFKEGKCLQEQGFVTKKIARLEATMQNISDLLSVYSSKRLDVDHLKTFVAQAKRSDVLSPAKNVFRENGSLIETPEKAFFDLLKNGKELLNLCGIKTPELGDLQEKNVLAPSFFFLYHPALGPLYSIISQKIRGGEINLFSEVVLEIAELYWENVVVEGSFRVLSKNPTGHLEKNEGVYSNLAPRAFFKNVVINNKGIDRKKVKDFWRCDFSRDEEVLICLKENAEVFAENISITGPLKITVEKNTRLIIKNKGNGIEMEKIPLEKPSWNWEYSINKKKEIVLNKKDA